MDGLPLYRTQSRGTGHVVRGVTFDLAGNICDHTCVVKATNHKGKDYI